MSTIAFDPELVEPPQIVELVRPSTVDYLWHAAEQARAKGLTEQQFTERAGFVFAAVTNWKEGRDEQQPRHD